ncbi:MAG: four helix bundle protein [Anaerolineales bacterium]|nr:four helix bundle protein [Anaerolineales bacterium]NUQ83990.1 four helix bundle protein [Anaerolineales bacterium]
MAGITRFEEIEAWKTARQLTNKVYELSNQTGFNRDFGLRDQIRRAGVSAMSNIAEGFESRTDVQFINYLGMAKASAGEVRAQLYVALDQKYIAEEQFKEAYSLAESCARQIAKFIAYLESNPRKRRISDDEADYKV